MRLLVPVNVKLPESESEVNVPAAGVVAPTVPLIGPAKPVDVSIVPLNVKLAESVSRPPLVENTTRVAVRPVLVMELNLPVPAVVAPIVMLLMEPAVPDEIVIIPAPVVVYDWLFVVVLSVIAPVALSVVNAPVDADDAPTVAPSIVPPLMSTKSNI